jgi:hypothetical protein
VGKLLVLASGVVKASGAGRAISAYVVLSAGAASRVFRVRGDPSAPSIEELPSATTLDIKRFQTELQEDLQPALAAAKSADPRAHVELTRAEWVCACVRKHIKELEGIDAE